MHMTLLRNYGNKQLNIPANLYMKQLKKLFRNLQSLKFHNVQVINKIRKQILRTFYN